MLTYMSFLGGPNIGDVKPRSSIAEARNHLGADGLARSPDHPPRLRPGVLAVAQHLHAVHEYVADAHGVLMRTFVRRPCGDALRIEDHDVREVAGSQQAAMVD